MSDEMLELLVARARSAPERRVPPARHRSTSVPLAAPRRSTAPTSRTARGRRSRPGASPVGQEAERPIVSVMRDRAILVHHPYESFTSSRPRRSSSRRPADPRVQSIKMTLYRAGGDSPIIRALIRAAERGVQVAVLVELKARFDEATNVNWAKQLERAGVHVVYGMVGLKTHSKCVLVVRDDGDQLRRYCHIGTGNYNTKTARLYEDLGILTCDIDIGADVAKLFNHLTGYSRDDRYHTLRRGAARPAAAAARADRAGDRPTAPEGRITIKANSIGDAEMIEALYERQPGRRADRPGHPRHLAACGPACPGCRRTSGSAASSGATSSTAGSTASPTATSTARPTVPHRVGRPHAAQPRPPGRGAGADRAPQAPGVARRGARVRSSPTTSCAGSCSPTTPGSGAAHSTRSSRTPRSACTAGWSSASSPSARPEPRRLREEAGKGRREFHRRI